MGCDGLDREHVREIVDEVALEELERRVDAVLAVLGGAEAVDVAAATGVAPALVVRWVELFLGGGRARMAGREQRPPTEDSERFLAMAAHEFLTPITIIRGWTTLLAEQDVDPAVSAQALRAIEAAAGKLERISRDVLDSAAVAMGRFRVVLSLLDARAVVTASVAALASERFDLRPGPPVWVTADEGRLGQIVDNLLRNALVHGGTEGIDVDVVTAGDHAVLTVVNGGEPPTYEAAAHLFEPFVRSDMSRGAGLGLYVVRALVVAHGGTIGVDVGDDRRTRFWVRLPVAGPTSSLLVTGTPRDRPIPPHQTTSEVPP